MQTRKIRRVATWLAAVCMLAACSRSADNPYAGIKDPPLVQARLHTVTMVSDDATIADAVRKQGYRAVSLATNYPASS